MTESLRAHRALNMVDSPVDARRRWKRDRSSPCACPAKQCTLEEQMTWLNAASRNPPRLDATRSSLLRTPPKKDASPNQDNNNEPLVTDPSGAKTNHAGTVGESYCTEIVSYSVSKKGKGIRRANFREGTIYVF